MASKRTYNESTDNGEEKQETPLTPRTVTLPRKRFNSNCSQNRFPFTSQNFVYPDNDKINQIEQKFDTFKETYDAEFFADSNLGSNAKLHEELFSEDKLNKSESRDKFSDTGDNASFQTSLFAVEASFLGAVVEGSDKENITSDNENRKSCENDGTLSSLNSDVDKNVASGQSVCAEPIGLYEQRCIDSALHSNQEVNVSSTYMTSFEMMSGVTGNDTFLKKSTDSSAGNLEINLETTSSCYNTDEVSNCSQILTSTHDTPTSNDATAFIPDDNNCLPSSSNTFDVPNDNTVGKLSYEVNFENMDCISLNSFQVDSPHSCNNPNFSDGILEKNDSFDISTIGSLKNKMHNGNFNVAVSSESISEIKECVPDNSASVGSEKEGVYDEDFETSSYLLFNKTDVTLSSSGNVSLMESPATSSKKSGSCISDNNSDRPTDLDFSRASRVENNFESNSQQLTVSNPSIFNNQNSREFNSRSAEDDTNFNVDVLSLTMSDNDPNRALSASTVKFDSSDISCETSQNYRLVDEDYHGSTILLNNDYTNKCHVSKSSTFNGDNSQTVGESAIDNYLTSCGSPNMSFGYNFSGFIRKDCVTIVSKDVSFSSDASHNSLKNIHSDCFIDKNVIDTVEYLKDKVSKIIDSNETTGSEVSISIYRKNCSQMNVPTISLNEANTVSRLDAQSVAVPLESLVSMDCNNVGGTNVAEMKNELNYDSKENVNNKDDKMDALFCSNDKLDLETVEDKFTRGEEVVEYYNVLEELQKQLDEEKKKSLDNYSLFVDTKSELDEALKKLESSSKVFLKAEDDYKTEISMLQGSVEELRETLSKCNYQILNLKEVNSTYNKISVELDRRVDALKTERDYLKKELEDKTVCLSESQSQLISTNTMLQECRGEIVDLKNSVEITRALYENCQTELLENKKIIASKDEREREDLLFAIERLTSEKEKIISENDKLNGLNGQLSENILSLESQLLMVKQKGEESKIELDGTPNQLDKIIFGDIGNSARLSKSSSSKTLKETISEIIEALRVDYDKLSERIDKIARDKSSKKENNTKVRTQLVSPLKEVQKEIFQEKVKIGNFLEGREKERVNLTERLNNLKQNEEICSLVEIIPSIRHVINEVSEIEKSEFSLSGLRQKLELLERINVYISRSCEELRMECYELESSVDNTIVKK